MTVPYELSRTIVAKEPDPLTSLELARLHARVIDLERLDDVNGKTIRAAIAQREVLEKRAQDLSDDCHVLRMERDNAESEAEALKARLAETQAEHARVIASWKAEEATWVDETGQGKEQRQKLWARLVGVVGKLRRIERFADCPWLSESGDVTADIKKIIAGPFPERAGDPLLDLLEACSQAQIFDNAPDLMLSPATEADLIRKIMAWRVTERGG